MSNRSCEMKAHQQSIAGSWTSNRALVRVL